MSSVATDILSSLADDIMIVRPDLLDGTASFKSHVLLGTFPDLDHVKPGDADIAALFLTSSIAACVSVAVNPFVELSNGVWLAL